MICVIGGVFFSNLSSEIVFFFFFQAEDGIRDKLVTGVQTCALPICCGCRGFANDSVCGRKSSGSCCASAPGRSTVGCARKRHSTSGGCTGAPSPACC